MRALVLCVLLGTLAACSRPTPPTPAQAAFALGSDDFIPLRGGLRVRRGHLSLEAIENLPLVDPATVDASTADQPTLAPRAMGGTRPSVINYWWTVSTYYIDKSNTSTHASDNNSCTTSSAPCLTWQEIAARWNESPGRWRFQQATKIVVMSGELTNTEDYANLDNLECEGGGYVLIQGNTAGTQVCTGALTANGTAQSRSGGTVPAVNGLPSACQSAITEDYVQSYFIEDTAGGSGLRGNAWFDTQNSTSSWNVTQPLVTAASVGFPIATTGMSLAEQAVGSGGAFASGDTVTVFTPYSFAISSMDPIVSQTSTPSSRSCVYLNQVALYDPYYSPGNNGGGAVSVRWGNNVTGYEVAAYATVQLTATADALDSGCVNCWAIGGYQGGRSSGTAGTAAGTAWYRIIAGGVESPSQLSGPGVALDGDVEVDDAITWTGGASLGLVNNQSGTTFNGGVITLAQLVHGYTSPGATFWGGNAFKLTGNARGVVNLSNGGGTWATTIYTTLSLNGATTACSLSSSTLTCGITLNTTNMGAAAGASGFGGFAGETTYFGATLAQSTHP